MGFTARVRIKRLIRQWFPEVMTPLDDVYLKVDVAAVDLNIAMYGFVWGSKSYTHMVGRMARTPKSQFQRFPNATVYLGLFDMYDHVPAAKEITQRSRDTKKRSAEEMPFTQEQLDLMGEFSYVSAFHKMTPQVEAELEKIFGSELGVAVEIEKLSSGPDSEAATTKTGYYEFITRLLANRSRKEDFQWVLARSLLLCDLSKAQSKSDRPPSAEYSATGFPCDDLFAPFADEGVMASGPRRIIIDGARWPNRNVRTDWQKWGEVTCLGDHSSATEEASGSHWTVPRIPKKTGGSTAEQRILKDALENDEELRYAFNVNAGAHGCPAMMPSILGKCEGVQGSATILSEELPGTVGEPDLRIVTWLAKLKPGTTVWFDCCDTDLIGILLLHLHQFYDEDLDTFSVQVYLNLTSSMTGARPRGTTAFHETRSLNRDHNGDKPAPWRDAHEVVDMNALWRAVHTQFQEWWPLMSNPVETFCLWMTIAGTDYVPKCPDMGDSFLWAAFVHGGWALLSAACKSDDISTGLLIPSNSGPASPPKELLRKRFMAVDETLVDAFYRFAYTFKGVTYYRIDPEVAWPACPAKTCKFLKDLRTTIKLAKKYAENTDIVDIPKAERTTVADRERIVENSYDHLTAYKEEVDMLVYALKKNEKSGHVGRKQIRVLLRDAVRAYKARLERHGSAVSGLYRPPWAHCDNDSVVSLQYHCQTANDFLREIFNAAWPVDAIHNAYTAKNLGGKKISRSVKGPPATHYEWLCLPRVVNWNLASYWHGGPFESAYTDLSMSYACEAPISGFERIDGTVCYSKKVWTPKAMAQVLRTYKRKLDHDATEMGARRTAERGTGKRARSCPVLIQTRLT